MSAIIIGGSYNPPHIGHFHLVEEVRLQLNPDLIILVPSYISPLKDPVGLVNAEKRYEVLRRAVQEVRGWDRVVVDRCEIDRKGPSFSIDTVKNIKNQYTEASDSLSLVIGDDLLEGLAHWHRIDELVGEVQILVAHRLWEEEVKSDYPYRYLENDILPMSSTDIRRRIINKKAFRFLVPSAVYEALIMNELSYD